MFSTECLIESPVKLTVNKRKISCDWVRNVFPHLSFAVFHFVFFTIGRFFCSRLIDRRSWAVFKISE